ncbi:osm-12 [Pristionchus pacificus]|uniref:Osm-12 n=1 Tax=Pristionchus pacificus TaxID=54126 RepID=A0A2A6BBH3_PRIPA|nr:osm-12 [Pristionchus pacificus]|eukprot:PDM63216.1 osm-12 [Pristionchus pacificus]
MSEIALTRVDLAQVGQTKRNCLKVIPVERDKTNGNPKSLERVVVGSVNGSVVCLFRKKNETQVAYKTPPGKPVEVVFLGGAVGSICDKVFIASDNVVRGVSKKGKHFFAFETNMAEPIRRMFISGVEMVTCGKRTYTHYHDCVQANHVVCPEDILDVVCLPFQSAWGDRAFTAVLACNDNIIRVIEASTVTHEIKLTDTPVTLQLFLGDGGHNKMHVIYGTKTGRLGLVDLPQKDPRIVWEMNTSSASAITAMTCYALTGNEGRKDVILGKDDGRIEIYVVESDDTHSDDIVVCTYTGWVFALTRIAEGSVSNIGPPVHAVNAKVQQLKNEVTELEQKVLEERNRYTEMISKEQDGSVHSYLPTFHIHESFELNKVTGYYILSISLVLPIEFIVVMSQVDIKLVDVERNNAVVGYTKPKENEEFRAIVTYRCQSSQTRVEMHMRVDEGEAGSIMVLIVPDLKPECGQFRRYDLKHLSLHVRTHSFDASRPLNTMQITGQFSLGEVHAWLVGCLDGIPARVPNTQSVVYTFQCLVDGGSQLEATAAKGSLTFRSDSVTTICTLRDIMNKETTRRNMRVSINCSVEERSVEHSLRLMHPKMSRLHDIHTKCKLAQALKELEANDAELSFLSEEYRQILNDYERLMRESENDPIEDTPLLIVYQRLFVSKWKLDGSNVTQYVPQLRELLTTNYDIDVLLSFFKAPHSFKMKQEQD